MMVLTAIAWFYLGFVIVRLLIVFLNVLSRPYLKHTRIKKTAKISVLIPARNEATTIGNLLDAVLNQTLLPFEILVYNDQSTDNTAKIVEGYQEKSDIIKLFHGATLPEGWLGKNHACYQLAKNASGSYFLFLDADVLPKTDLLEKAMARIDKYHLKLLSIFPQQYMKTLGEKLTVPLMHNILLSLLPLFYVRKSKRVAFSAANGQFMLFEAKTYKHLQPHQWMKDKITEDIAIMRLYKKFHVSAETLLGNHAIACRMYKNFDEAINGFAKNIRNFFGGSSVFMLLYVNISVLGWITWFALPIPYVIFGIVSLLMYHLLLILLSGRKVMTLFLLPFQTLVTCIVALKSMVALQKNNLTWKGRKI